MISPEILRRNPFFANLADADLKAIAMISEEAPFAKGETIYATGQPNHSLYFLTDGAAESFLVITDPNNEKYHKEYYLDDLDLGEVFGISAMVDPAIHTTTARASKAGKLVRIDGPALTKLFDNDPKLGNTMLKEMIAQLLYRLQQDRIQLAAMR
jgi:CRP/FNR family transcriptional regulator, dissimilatory nitrate respiration regulator